MRNPLLWRLEFAAFLESLTLGEEKPGEWSRLVVAKYFDEELEDIRHKLVRLSIARDIAFGGVWTEEDCQQLREWSAWLRNSVATIS